MHAQLETEQTSGLPDRFGLPLLFSSIEQSSRSRHYVLDFGPIQPLLVNRIRDAAGKLQVVDVQPEEFAQDHLASLLKTQISDPPNRYYQLVLAWDMLNYFSTDQLQLLDAVLSESGAPGLQLHALIRYSKPDMPGMPDRFVLLDEHQVEQSARVSSRIKAPRYTPKALEKWMPGFKVDRTRLLGNGMQEYLFRSRNGR